MGRVENGEIKGLWREWYSEGVLKNETLYTGGRSSSVRHWFSNGQLFISFEESSKQTGVYKTYFENGQIEKESYIKNNKMDSLEYHWDELGRLKKNILLG